jgi:hypothetical protein
MTYNQGVEKNTQSTTINPEPGESESSKLDDFVSDVEAFYTYFNEHIFRARNFLTFLYVDQWEPQIRNERNAIAKPTLQFNKLVSIIRGILGEQRNNTPALAVRDISTHLTVPQSMIDTLTDLIREIFYYSDADVVFQVAFKQMLECGWGTCRVITKYAGPDTFDQIICLEPIVDFQVAYWDPVAQEPDKSDGDFCGLYTIVSKTHFKRMHPDVPNPESLMGYNMTYYLPWNNDEAVVVCEMYRKEYFKKKIVKLSNGMTLDEKEAKEFLALQDEAMTGDDMLSMIGMEKVEIEDERTVDDFKIKHYKFVQNKILDETNWPGKILPIPYGDGDSTIIDGRKIPLPYIQDAIDVQKMINYVASEVAYAILRSRKETIMATPSNVRGFEDVYRNPEQVQGALMYNPDEQTKEPPKFMNPPVMSPEIMQVHNEIVQDLQQILGRYEESRGQQSNAISGVAIAKRKAAGNNAVNVYQDNLKRLMKSVGRIMLDLIPHIYDSHDRNVIVRSSDNKTRQVTLNKRKGYIFRSADGEPEPILENDVSKGKYDIDVRVDGTFDEQKQAALDFFLGISQANPQVFNLIADLLAETSGLENAQKLMERFKTLVPPQILAQEEGKPMPPPPPPPPPPPEVILQTQKNQLLMQANANKAKQMALDEQKMMIEQQNNGMSHQVSLAKAAAEVAKAHVDKDIALLNHGTAIHANSNKTTP